MDADVIVTREGMSLCLFRPQTDEALDWLLENVLHEDAWMGNTLVVETRYVGPLVEALASEGFTVA